MCIRDRYEYGQHMVDEALKYQEEVWKERHPQGLSLIHISTGITATAGIGTNLFLCKVAIDIGAKHIPADKNGVRIAELDEMKFRRELW